MDKFILSRYTTYIARMAKRADVDVMIVLSEQDVIPLVLYLDERRGEKTVQSDLKAISKGLPKLHKTAEHLEDLGIIKIQIVNQPRRTLIYNITEKGRRLAKAFREAQAIARDD